MTTLGLIGSGHIGSTVARLAVDAGHDVVLSNSRGPETLADLVAELGPHARAATPAEAAAAGDLVVTQDIPLAAQVVAKGALAVNPRGVLYSADTIAQQLSMRNFMDKLRGAGVDTGGPAAFHPRDRQAFANQLDSWLQRRPKAP